MRIAAIVQRYGADIVGGAESLCRGVAEGLVGRGHEVEVMTTCARSYQTWANSFPEGVEDLGGVLVRRFQVEEGRDMASFNAASERLFGHPHTIDDQRNWVRIQGPYAPHLIHYLHGVAADFDRLLFFTYLYHPTVFGIHVAPDRSVLVPTAHDEAPIYLEVYESVFALPAGMIFNSEAEASFVRRRFPRLKASSAVVGVGIERLDDGCGGVGTVWKYQAQLHGHAPVASVGDVGEHRRYAAPAHGAAFGPDRGRRRPGRAANRLPAPPASRRRC